MMMVMMMMTMMIRIRRCHTPCRWQSPRRLWWECECRLAAIAGKEQGPSEPLPASKQLEAGKLDRNLTLGLGVCLWLVSKCGRNKERQDARFLVPFSPFMLTNRRSD